MREYSIFAIIMFNPECRKKEIIIFNGRNCVEST